MVDKSEILDISEKLDEFTPRLRENEQKAAEFIQNKLNEKNANVFVQEYDVVYPIFEECWLKADGEEVECLPSGFKSGKIGKSIVDSLNVDERIFNKPNINFNPKCSGISVLSWYDSPAVAVSRKDIPKILEAKEVEGRLKVEWQNFKSQNLLVGNVEDPEIVILTHYDSFWGGHIDNGLSVAILLEMVDSFDLSNCLIVFAGSEEISNQDPYWCRGYRQFESEFYSILESCSEIAVVDGVGRGKTQSKGEEWILEKALVLNNAELFWDKTSLLMGNFEEILEVNHSPIDIPGTETHLEDAIEFMENFFDSYLK